MTTQRWSVSTLVGQLKHELRQIGLVTLYFFFSFGVVLTLKKLLLADYQIEFYAMSATVVGALVAAKIVVVLDKTRAGTRFDATHPLWLSVLYKTVVYSLAAAAVLSLERVFHAYREAGQLGQALTEVWMHRDRNVILAKVICIGLAFAVYHLYAGLDRRLGEGTLRRLVMTRRQGVV